MTVSWWLLQDRENWLIFEFDDRLSIPGYPQGDGTHIVAIAWAKCRLLGPLLVSDLNNGSLRYRRKTARSCEACQTCRGQDIAEGDLQHQSHSVFGPKTGDAVLGSQD